MGGALIVLHEDAGSAIPRLALQLGVQAVFVNRDYEPSAVQRDAEVARSLQSQGSRLLSFKDQVIFDTDEVLSLAGKPFSVFTPYKKAWLKKLLPEPGRHADDLLPYPVDAYAHRFAEPPFPVAARLLSLAEIGFSAARFSDPDITPGMRGARQSLDAFAERMADYVRDRDFPALEGTSRLSVHLRFGTISLRSLVRRALESVHTGHESSAGATLWLSELIWREFFSMILHHYPHVATRAFKP